MTVQDVINDAKYGELRSLAVKNDDAAVISYINLALTVLYEKFKLKTSEVLIPLHSNIVEYDLPTDLMTPLSVYDENGDEFSINIEEDRFGVFFPGYGTIQVANPSNGATISIIYVAGPERVTATTDIVKIPPQLLEPMLHYIGYRGHGAINGDIKSENNSHYMRFVASCERIIKEGSIRRDVVPAWVNLREKITETSMTYEEVDLNT